MRAIGIGICISLILELTRYGYYFSVLTLIRGCIHLYIRILIWRPCPDVVDILNIDMSVSLALVCTRLRKTKFLC